jgi:phage terminase small subunit
MPGRPPKPLSLHRLQGTYNATRHGARAHEPRAPGELAEEPPAWMNERQQRIWRETLADAPKGILRRVDRQMFTEYVGLVDIVTEAQRAQNKLELLDAEGRPQVYLRVIRQTVEVLCKLRGEMGFSPVSRTRLGTAAAPAEEAEGFAVVRGAA